MIDFTTAFLDLLATTFVPGCTGILASTLVKVSRSRRLAAYGFGIFLWYFSDGLGASAYLGVNSGLSGGNGQLALVTLFVVGGLAFFAVDARVSPRLEGPAKGASLSTVVLVSLALSLHGAGEGADFGALSSSISATTIVAELGGYGPAISYVLHKILEAVMIGAVYASLPGGTDRGGRLRNSVLLALILTIPSLVGLSMSYYFSFDTTYLFAVGTGASAYAGLMLVRPLFNSQFLGSNLEYLKQALLLLLGFISIYFAALLHSTPVGY
ncbi:MAG: hypothetical protein LYZ70_02500 [Nitrososphaerales archaeon]|nr:hypothetical protein [Nitrososphaerales archaeon]